MAGPSGGGKSHCPACGASANNSNIGRDGSPRVLGGSRQALSNDPKIVKRRNRAAKNRYRNSIA